MMTILKLVIAFLIAFFIFDKYENRDKKVVNVEHKCNLGSDKCKLCPKKKKQSLFAHNAPVRKKIVYKNPEDVCENEVSIYTEEGKEQLRRNIGWLTELYANQRNTN